MLRRKLLPVVLTVLLILGGLTASVFAQDPPPSEDGLPESVQDVEIIGDDPDENGFSGEDNRSIEPITPSETGGEQVFVDINLTNAPDSPGYSGEPLILDQPVIPSEADNGLPGIDFPSLEGEPDQRSAAETNITRDDEGIRWSGFYYYHVAGSTFHTRQSTSTWAYGGSGCVYRTNGTQPFVLFLDLPDGSRIDYLRVYYNDSDAVNGFAGIIRYNGLGTFEDLVSVYSDGNSGYGTQLSSFVGHVVDNYEWAYTVFWNPNTNSSTVQMCSLRVAYRLP
jgi:hypothetical protein